MSLDDVLAIEGIDLANVSPDGTLVAAVVLRAALPGETYGRTTHEVDPSRSDVWIMDRGTGARRNLTMGRVRAAGAWCATWSPDGQHLAFLSTRPEGAEPQGGNNVRLYVWERQSDRIRRLGDRAVVTQTRYGAGIHKLDMAGPGVAVPNVCKAGDENSPFAWLDASHLLVATLPPGQTSALLDASERIYRHTNVTNEAIRAGKETIASASGSGAERTNDQLDVVALLAIVDIDNSTWADVTAVPAYPFNGSLGVRVSPDGRRAAVLATTATIPPRAGVSWPKNDGEWLVEKRLGFVDLLRGQPVRWLPLPVSASLPVKLEGWNSDGKNIRFTARAELQNQIATQFLANSATGRICPLSTRPKAPSQSRPSRLPKKAELIVSDTRGLVWSENTPHGSFIRASLPDGSEPRELIALNRHFENIDLGRTMTFDYIGEEGKLLKAAVLLPPDYSEGKKLPVITWVYGGATIPGWDEYSLNPFMPGIYNLRLYAARGYAVLVPSIPLKRDGKQNPLLALAPNVIPAVDKLIELGIADPARIGVMGQSFGGYTALGLTTQSDRFRAVVAIAPLSDLSAFYSTFDATARGNPGIEHERSTNAVIAELAAPGAQVPPYADPDRYLRNSPLTFVNLVTAPVLLIHGEHDVRGATYQSEAFFTGLWRQGKTARIVRYWGEDHALGLSPATVRSVVSEITLWFDKYLAPPDSLPPQ